MYRISQLMSTPVAGSSGYWSKREYTRARSPTYIFPSFVCDFLNSDSSYECCSIDPLTGSHFTCRRSPRLLTNGYYIWTEDSFLCDENGNVTLSPSQTSVLYKENLVRVFRKKKRIRHSLSSIFDLQASKSWLHGSMFEDADSSTNNDIWFNGIRRLDTTHCNESGGDFDYSLTNEDELEQLNAECVKASSSGHTWPQTPEEKSHNTALQSQARASEHFQGNLSDHSEISLWREVSFQTILLIACLIISTCARWFLGGILANVFTGSLMITIFCVVKLFFHNLISYFKLSSYVQSRFAKI
ncbi:transmembrane protein 71 [Sorex araneus]|uniref:transmembrane protein 71 n=1 Tax=Sorex araneus TaxID=42254 RepID=UPI0024336AA2|nr:transmembrane protein 71 [Sorex araneus]